MRVLHIHSGNLYGGVETTLMAQVRHRQLCPEMNLSFALCFEGRFSEELRKAGAAVGFIGNCRIRNPIAVKKARAELYRLLCSDKYDIAVTHSAWSQSLFASMSRSMGIPFVSWIHGLVNPKYWLERWARLTPPSLVIANSHFTAASIKAAYPQVRAEVVYNPLVTRGSASNHGARAAVRKTFNIPDDTVVIIQVSRMESCKGHEILLHALAQLRDMKNWTCLEVGGPQRKEEFAYLDDLKLLTARLGISDRVKFLGERSDVPDLLSTSDILCQPNVGPETFGNVFIEGMVAGIPVVTTAIGGALEIIDQTCGILVPPNDPQTLASTLRELIGKPQTRETLVNGPIRAHALCGVESQMTKIVRVLESALAA